MWPSELPCERADAAGAAEPPERLRGLAARQLPPRRRRAAQSLSSSALFRRPRSDVPGRGCPPPPGGRPASGGAAGATAWARGGGGGSCGCGCGEHAQFPPRWRRRVRGPPEQERCLAAGMEPPPGAAAAAAVRAEARPGEEAEEEESAAQPAQAPPGGGGAASRGKARGAGGRRGGARAQPRLRRQVTVDSSKARTSLDALKISLRQLRWREVSRATTRGRAGQGAAGAPAACLAPSGSGLGGLSRLALGGLSRPGHLSLELPGIEPETFACEQALECC